MNDPFAIAIQGLGSIDMVEGLPAAIERNAVRALNRTIERARASSVREMRAQVNFPARYLTGAEGRLAITKKATTGDLESVITGRHRPTSLARFATSVTKRRPGISVMVQPGLATFLPRAFFINLRVGNTDTLGNKGLAIRLPAGQRPDRAYKPTPVGRGVWLLYGPSIDQVFDDVAGEISPDTAEFLEAEFLRLMNVSGLPN